MCSISCIDIKICIAFSTSPGVDNSFSGTCDRCGDVMCVSVDVTGHRGGKENNVNTSLHSSFLNQNMKMLSLPVINVILKARVDISYQVMSN